MSKMSAGVPHPPSARDTPLPCGHDSCLMAIFGSELRTLNPFRLHIARTETATETKVFVLGLDTAVLRAEERRELELA